MAQLATPQPQRQAQMSMFLACSSPWAPVDDALKLLGYSLGRTTGDGRPDASSAPLGLAPGSARSELWTPAAAAAAAAAMDESSNDSTTAHGAAAPAGASSLMADCSALLALEASGFATGLAPNAGASKQQGDGLQPQTLVWGALGAATRGGLAAFGGPDGTSPLAVGFPDAFLAGTPSYLAVHGLGGAAEGAAPGTHTGGATLQHSPAFQLMQTLAAARMAQQHPFAAYRPTTPCDPAIVGRNAVVSPPGGANNKGHAATTTTATSTAAQQQQAQQQEAAAASAAAVYPWMLSHTVAAPLTPAGHASAPLVLGPLGAAGAATSSGPVAMSTPTPAVVVGAGAGGATSPTAHATSVILTPSPPTQQLPASMAGKASGLRKLSAGRVCKPPAFPFPAGAPATSWPLRTTPFSRVMPMECMEALERLNTAVQAAAVASSGARPPATTTATVTPGPTHPHARGAPAHQAGPAAPPAGAHLPAGPHAGRSSSKAPGSGGGAASHKGSSSKHHKTGAQQHHHQQHHAAALTSQQQQQHEGFALPLHASPPWLAAGAPSAHPPGQPELSMLEGAPRLGRQLQGHPEGGAAPAGPAGGHAVAVVAAQAPGGGRSSRRSRKAAPRG